MTLVGTGPDCAARQRQRHAAVALDGLQPAGQVQHVRLVWLTFVSIDCRKMRQKELGIAVAMHCEANRYCVDGSSNEYLGRRLIDHAFQNALQEPLTCRCQACRSDLFSSELPVYRKLLSEAPHLKILVFTCESHDTSPFTETLRAVAADT